MAILGVVHRGGPRGEVLNQFRILLVSGVLTPPRKTRKLAYKRKIAIFRVYTKSGISPGGPPGGGPPP